MERNRALSYAGAITLASTAAVVAIGANLGLFGLTTRASGAGRLSPTAVMSTTTPAAPQIVYVTDPATTPPVSTTVRPATSAEGDPTAVASAPAGKATASPAPAHQAESGDDTRRPQPAGESDD